MIEHEAYKVAVREHGEQMYGDKPYEFHLQAVRDVLVEFGYTDELYLAAAWLHDILEDTDYPARKIYEQFGSTVLNMVWAVTGFGPNRQDRADCVYRKINGFQNGAILKAADRIANMRASIGTNKEQMYHKAWPGFKEHVLLWTPPNLRQELIRLHEGKAVNA